jgi:MFS family permease
MPSRRRILLGVVITLGAAISIAGVLLPFATLPTGETVGFWTLNQGFTLLLISLALLAAGLGFTRIARFAFVPAVLAGAAAGYGVSTAFNRIETAREEIQNLIEGSPFGALASNLLGDFVIHENWMLIFVGAGVSIIGSLLAFLKDNRKQKAQKR